MNNLLQRPIGLDKTIQGIQEDIYNEMQCVWQGNLVGYGRVEKTPVNDGESVPDYYQTSKIVIPEWYNARLKDYEEVYYNDDNAAQFCFLVGDTDSPIDERTFVSQGKVVFWVDLSRIYPIEEERATSRAHRDVMEVLRNFNLGRYEIGNIEKRIDIIFREYKTSNVQFNDMHPLHCFAVNLDLTYYLTDKCS